MKLSTLDFVFSVPASIEAENTSIEAGTFRFHAVEAAAGKKIL